MRTVLNHSRSFALVTGFLIGGIAADPAMAGFITYNFDGDVDRVGRAVRNVPPTNNFTTASTMSGSIRVNDTPISQPGNRAIYEITNFTVTVGNYTVSFNTLPTSNQVEIRNVTSGSNTDRFLVSVDDLNGNPVNTLGPAFFEIDLQGDKNIFSNKQLPTAPGNLANLFDDNAEWRLVFGSGGNRRTVGGELTSLTAVPLPPAAILFGIGLIALIGFGAGGLRNIRLPQA